VSDQTYKFYAAKESYFSAKVRPFFRYKSVPVEELPPTPQAFRDVIRRRTGLAFIPIVITPEDDTLQDTSDILDELERRFPEPPIYPPTPRQRVVSYLLELYADEFLILPGLHYRWSFPESEAKARRDFTQANGGDEATAGRFADRIKGALPFVGVTPATIPAIEAHTRELLDALSTHFQEHEYLLGSRMSLADLALLGPLYAHLSLDAVPSRILEETAPRVLDWIARMNAPIPGAGNFLADDEIPATLVPLLELVGADAVPLFLDNLRDVESWADHRPTDLGEIPRGVGSHESTLRGIKVQRMTSPYTLWMVQRPLDAYRALDEDDRAIVATALAGTGLLPLLEYKPRHRLTKHEFKLAFVA